MLQLNTVLELSMNELYLNLQGLVEFVNITTTVLSRSTQMTIDKRLCCPTTVIWYIDIAHCGTDQRPSRMLEVGQQLMTINEVKFR